MSTSRAIEAPSYEPAAAYIPPTKAPFRFGVETVSLAELMSTQATWKIVLDHAPLFATFVKSPDVSPYLSTMSLDSFIPFGLISQIQIDAINADLVHLPRDQWPAL